MQRFFAALALGAALLTTPVAGVSVALDGAPLELEESPAYEGVTYVPLRSFMLALRSGAQVNWEEDRALVVIPGLTITAKPGESTLTANGQTVELPGPVHIEQGRTLVPLRPLAGLLGLEVAWEPQTGVTLTTPGPEAGELYWLSHIISAESQGECWEGQIAVGNVVLNRAESPLFPDTIYDVIFDERWGGQFEPVRNGAVYLSPTEQSIEAAQACLAGENTVGDSLYFLAPDLTENHWTMENRDYVTTIGVHWFYR